MPMDRPHHSHLCEDHRAIVRCRPRDAVGRGLDLSILCSDFGISFASHGIGEGPQLTAVWQFDRLFKTPGPGHNAAPQIKNGTGLGLNSGPEFRMVRHFGNMQGPASSI